MDERTPCEILMFDMGGRVAEVEALELAGVTFTQRDELRVDTLQPPRLFDVSNRDNALGTVGKGVARNGKSSKYGDAADTSPSRTRCAHALDPR